MRMGRVTGVCDPRAESAASLSRLMIGGEPPREARVTTERGPVRLACATLSVPRAHAFATELQQIALDVHAGEIVGIAGVSGNGQRELLAALGEDLRGAAGSVQIDQQPVGRLDAAAPPPRGLAFVPEERLGRGAVPGMSLSANTCAVRTGRRPMCGRHGCRRRRPRGWRPASSAVSASRPAGRRRWRAACRAAPQKFIVGREIESGPKVLIVAQPTWGVDVGAAAQIHNEILALRATGCAVLVVSEELDELVRPVRPAPCDGQGPPARRRFRGIGHARAGRPVDERLMGGRAGQRTAARRHGGG